MSGSVDLQEIAPRASSAASYTTPLLENF